MLSKIVHQLYPSFKNPSQHAVNTLVIFHPQKKYITDPVHEDYFNEVGRILHNVKFPFTNVVLVCEDGYTDKEVVWEPLDESLNQLRMEFPNVSVFRCFGEFTTEKIERYIMPHADKGDSHLVFLAGTFHEADTKVSFNQVTSVLSALPHTTLLLVEPLDVDQTDEFSLDGLSDLIIKMFTDPSVEVNKLLEKEEKTVATVYFEDFEIPTDETRWSISKDYLGILQKYVFDMYPNQSVIQIPGNVYTQEGYMGHNNMIRPALLSPVFVGRSGLGGWSKFGPNDTWVVIEFTSDGDKLLVKAQPTGERMFKMYYSFEHIPKQDYGQPLRNKLGHVLGVGDNGRFLSAIVYQGFMPNPANTDEAWERTTVIAVQKPYTPDDKNLWVEWLDAKIDTFLVTILKSWLKANVKN